MISKCGILMMKKMLGIEIRMRGMMAENQQRECSQMSPAYTECDFLKLLNELEIKRPVEPIGDLSKGDWWMIQEGSVLMVKGILHDVVNELNYPASSELLCAVKLRLREVIDELSVGTHKPDPTQKLEGWNGEEWRAIVRMHWDADGAIWWSPHYDQRRIYNAEHYPVKVARS